MTGSFAGCNVGEYFSVVHAACKEAGLEHGSVFKTGNIESSTPP